jgi:hypothetical protein
MAGTNAERKGGLGAETRPLAPRTICMPRSLGDAKPWHAEAETTKLGAYPFMGISRVHKLNIDMR